MAKFKTLYYVERPGYFCIKVGDFPCYFDKDMKWLRLNLAVVKRRNMARCPRLYTKR